MPQPNIGIVGGGIAGLTTALALQQKGSTCTLYERAGSFSPVGAGIWLAPNPLEVFKRLGILEKVQAQGHTINRISLLTDSGGTLTDVPQNAVKERFGFSTVAIHRAKLIGLLSDSLNSTEVHFNKTLKSIHESSSGVRLSFKDGSSSQHDFVLGCDGIHSNVRKAIFPKSETRFSGQTCWRGIAQFKAGPDLAARGIEFWGKNNRFGLSPLDAESVYWFAVKDEKDVPKDLKSPKDYLQKELDHYPVFVQQLVTNTTEYSLIRGDIYDLQPLAKWHTERICLMGDAAHATTPNMGQGGAQAIEDAYWLAETVAEHGFGEAGFAAFQTKRYKRVNEIVNRSWQIGKMAHWKRGRGLRNFMMRSMPAGLVKKQMMGVYEL